MTGAGDFWRLLKKETRELLRPRYLLPLLLVPLLFVAMGQGIGGIEESLAGKPTVGIVDADDGEYGDIVVGTVEANAEVVYTGEPGTDPEAALEEVDAEGGSALIVVPPDFTETIRSGQRATIEVYSVVDSVSIVGLASSAQVDGLVAASAHRITLAKTNATETDLAPVGTAQTTYLQGERIDASPGQLSGAFSQRFLFVPVIIMLVILVSGQMVINSMGIEKEHKTLETLLTMPVRRRTIIGAKLIGSASIGLVGAAVYTAALVYYQSSLSFGGAVDVPLSLSMVDYGLIGVSIFFALVGVLALALCLGVFAGDRQGAQMLLFPLSILAVVPMFVTMFADVTALGLAPKLALFAIPFTHPIIAPKRLLFGDVGLVLAGITYEMVFAGAMIYVAIRLFNSDRLVAGSSGRLGRYIRRLQE